jgi:predicted O-methyltransferase YrrM
MDEQAKLDSYFDELFAPHDHALEAALRDSEAAGLPRINIAPSNGKLLHVLTRGRRRVLEIGTLGGYSAIWMARALPSDGRLVSLELDEHHAEVARANLERAGVGGITEVRVGPAAETLPGLAAEEPFDLVFIDADKAAYPDYLPWALELTRPGSLIIADNVARRIRADHPDDAGSRGIRRFNDLLAAEPRVSATVVQTFGARGQDGIAIATVLDR